MYAVYDSRGLAPTGWHVPSDSEWSVLSTCLGGDLVAGGAMKESGTKHWLSPNTGATNSSGFTALPGGYRQFDGPFYFIGQSGSWWSSSENNYATFIDASYSILWNTASVDSILQRAPPSATNGYSVRCVKN